jgi:hypothetical protein
MQIRTDRVTYQFTATQVGGDVVRGAIPATMPARTLLSHRYWQVELEIL